MKRDGLLPELLSPDFSPRVWKDGAAPVPTYGDRLWKNA